MIAKKVDGFTLFTKEGREADLAVRCKVRVSFTGGLWTVNENACLWTEEREMFWYGTV